MSRRLSPIDIQHAEFSRSVGGYDRKEVRAFLERLSVEVEAGLREAQALRQKLDQAEARMEELKAAEAELQRAVMAAERIATDMKEEAMAEAEKLGAVTVPGGEGQVERIREATGGKGADVVLDFVGVGATVKTAMQSVARQGRVSIVGIGNLSPYEWAFLTTPYEAELVNTYWGTVEELHEVVDMYKAGQIVPQVTRYSLDDALEAYQALVDGKIAGRAVIVPHQ